MAVSKPLVLIIGSVDGTVVRETLGTIADIIVYKDMVTEVVLSDEEAADVVGIVVGMPPIRADLLDRCKKLKVIVRTGIGFDSVDIVRAAELGICVCNVPDYGVEDVADTTLALMLSLFRQTSSMHQSVQKGESTATYEDFIAKAGNCRRLRDKTLGLVGIGKIGIAVAVRAKAFGMCVVFYDPYVADGLDRAVGGLQRLYSLEELISQSDCVSLHCMLTEENRHMINETTLKLFKKDAFLVNVSRGPLIDEKALATALKEGWIAGAGLDVHEVEPFSFNTSPLKDIRSLICIPHVAWYSLESFMDLRTAAAKALLVALNSTNPDDLRNCVNKRSLNMDACRQRWSAMGDQ